MLDFLKKTFPPIGVPKRYIALAGMLIYYAMKAYVSSTPTTIDDQVLEQIKQAVLASQV